MREVMLVTGVSRGIGAATAVCAAERGYDVAIGYLQDSAAAESSYATGALLDVSGGR